VNGLSEVLGEFTNRAGAGNNLTNGRANGKTETRDKSSSLGAELEKEALSVGAGDLEDILNLRSKVLNNLVALQVVADSGENGSNRRTDGRQTKAREETRKASGELDEKVLATLADDGKKVLGVRAEVLDKLTNRARTGDNGADGAAESRETKTGQKASNFRAELDQEALGVRASDLKDVANLRAKVLDDMSTGGSRRDLVGNGVQVQRQGCSNGVNGGGNLGGSSDH
jgi:hypothetical protein